MRALVWITVLLAGLAGFSVQAGESDEQAAIRAALEQVLPADQITHIEPSAVPGLYEVMAGTTVFYMSADGRHLVRGEILRLEDQQNLTAQSRSRGLQRALAALDEDTMVIFEPDEVEHTVTVFTDIDCGYCRQFQREMDGYLERGIRVRYLFFPRSGPDTPSYDKAVAVWCSDDRQDAMTRAKAGENVRAGPCDNPVRDHLALVQQFDVTGTPAVYTQSGRHIGGYLAPARMAQALEQ